MPRTDVDECRNRSVRIHGDCTLCQRHLCSVHILKTEHDCPRWDDIAWDSMSEEARKAEITDLFSRVNSTALIDHASRLRNDMPCTIPIPDVADLSKIMGNVNVHLQIQFRDGVRWIARIKRQNVTTPPLKVQKLVIESEVATYHFLATTQIPAPRVFDFCASSENEVGVPYILMEEVAGKPYSEYAPNPQQKMKVTEQLAVIYQEIYKHPFDAIGSLHLQPESPGFSIGPVATELLSDVDDGGCLRTLGLFQTGQQYYQAKLSRILEFIIAGQLYSPWAIDTYLIHRSLQDFDSTHPQISTEREKFYLRHADDQGSHIMIDEDYNICGIIDWEWAFTVPAEIAFTSPMMLWDVGAFFEGSLELSKEEHILAWKLDQGRDAEERVGRYVTDGKSIQRLQFVIGNEIFDWNISSYRDMFLSLCFGPMAGRSWKDWKAEALNKYAADEGLQRLQRANEDVATS